MLHMKFLSFLSIHACTHANITVRVSAGYQVPEQICSCVLRARLKMAFYYGEETVQLEPTVTICLLAFKMERSFSGITTNPSACTHMLKNFCRQERIKSILQTSLILSSVTILVVELPLWSLMAHLVMADGTEWKLSGKTFAIKSLFQHVFLFKISRLQWFSVVCAVSLLASSF